MDAIWESNPEVNLLYCFEDGNCFAKHGEAASYAREKQLNYTIKQREEKELKTTKIKK